MNTLLLGATYSAMDKVTGPVRKMMQSVSSFENMTRNGKGMQEWGTKVAIGAAMIGAAGDKIKSTLKGLAEPYMELEMQLVGLDQVIKSSGNNQVASLAAAKKAAKDWEKQHGDSAAKFIATTQQMSEANLQDVDAIRASRYAMSLSKATMSEANVAGELLIYTYQALGDKSKNASDEIRKQADMTAKLKQTYQMRNLAEFTDAMKDAAPAAALLGQKYEAAAVGVATLQQAGWKGGKAGSSYASILGQMQKASTDLGFTLAKTADGGMDFVKTVDNISKKYGDLQKVTPAVRDELKAAFGDDGLRALMIYQQQSGKMKQAMDELRDSTGAAAAGRDKLENTDFGRMQKSLQQLDGLKVGIAERIFGNPKVMDEIIPRFISTVEWAVNLGLAFADAHPELTSTLVVLTAIGLGLLLIVSPIMSVVGGFLTMGGTVLSACGTAGGAVAKFYGFVASGDAITKGQALIRLLQIKYLAFSGCVVKTTAAVQTFGLRMLAAGKAGTMAAAQGIKSFTLGVLVMGKSAILTATTALPSIIAGTWAFTAALLANPMTWVVLGIMALIAAIVLCIVYWDDIAAACGVAWEWIKSTASEGMGFLKTLPSQYLNFLGSIGSMFFAAGKALWTTFADGVGSVISAPMDFIKKGVALIDDYLPHSDARKGPLSRLTWSGQRLMTTFAAGIPKGYQTLQSAVQKGWDILTFPSGENQGNPFEVGGGSGKNPPPPIDGEGPNVAKRAATKTGGISFHGPVTFKFDKVEKPEDFMKQLQELAAETGAV